MTEETPAPKKPKPTKGPGSAKRTNGDRGRFAKVPVDHDAVFDLYYAMGGSRSYHKLVAKVAEELGEKVSVQALIRWASAEGWQDRVKARDIETGANIADALKILEGRGQKVTPAHFKGLVAHGMETATRCMYAMAIKTPHDLIEFVEALIKIDRYAAEMSTGAIAEMANGSDGKVVLGKFQQTARAHGFAAGAAGSNGNGAAAKE